MVVSLKVPKNWNDLSHQQLKNISYQFECFRGLVKDTPEAIEFFSTKLFIQLSKEILRNNKWQHIRVALKEIQPKAFTPLIEFLYKQVERTKFIPELKIKSTTYYSPAIRMRNCTIAEFAYVDAAFYNWHHTTNPVWLNVLCAALYREPSVTPSDIDKRKPFIKQSVDARADILSNLDTPTKLAIAYTYEGCRNHIAKTYPLIFPKPIEAEGATQPQPRKKYISFGEIIIDKINGDPSKLEATNNINLYDFLNIYNNDIKKLPKK